jgi:hypothetical protein
LGHGVPFYFKKEITVKQVFHFYADPGHGWLAVKKHYLHCFGIASQITPYSYQRGDTAYLEEDCDLSIFLAALKEADIEADIRSHHTDHQSRIRGYNSYRCQDTGMCKIEKVSEGLWLVRNEKNERIGEVFGIKGKFQAQTMTGVFVANGRTLCLAAKLLDSAQYHVVAIVHDPRTNEGMKDVPTMGYYNESRDIALIQARRWANDGYWTTVYNTVSGEALYDFPPYGGVQ